MLAKMLHFQCLQRRALCSATTTAINDLLLQIMVSYMATMCTIPYHKKHIGEVDERWQALDTALVNLNPSIRFTNAKFFESKLPRRLLYRSQVY